MGKEADEFIYELLDGIYKSRAMVLSQDKKRLVEVLEENGINYRVNKF